MSESRSRVDWTLPFALLIAVAGGGCDSDLLDVQVDLQRQVYQEDFGATQATIPVVACDASPAGTDVCGASNAVDVQSGAIAATVQVGCDATTDRCFAQARVLGATPVDVLQDDDFVTKVERRSVVVVRAVDIAYVVPGNTLTFDVPGTQIFVGPPGTTAETDPGVVLLGTTAPLSAGATIDQASAGHLTVADGSAGHSFIEQSILGKQAMVFLVLLTPRLEAGAAFPAGAIELDLLPRLSLGLPR